MQKYLRRFFALIAAIVLIGAGMRGFLSFGSALLALQESRNVSLMYGYAIGLLGCSLLFWMGTRLLFPYALTGKKEGQTITNRFFPEKKLKFIYEMVKNGGGDIERAQAFVPQALQYLKSGTITREEFLERLERISYAKISSDSFWRLYDENGE
jgi:hypothetical protein